MRWPTVWVFLAALALAACGSVGPPASSPPAGTAAPSDTDDATAEPTDAEETERPANTPTLEASTATPATETSFDVNRLATGERPAGWVEVQSNSPSCTMAVPGDWLLTPLSASWMNGRSPDDHMGARAVQDSITDWPAYIDRLKATYFTVLSDDSQVILVNTDRLFLMRETANGGKAHVMALNGGTTACGIVESIDEVAADQWAQTAVDMLYTLKAPDIGASAAP